jgi:hypothetical protein
MLDLPKLADSHLRLRRYPDQSNLPLSANPITNLVDPHGSISHLDRKTEHFLIRRDIKDRFVEKSPLPTLFSHQAASLAVDGERDFPYILIPLSDIESVSEGRDMDQVTILVADLDRKIVVHGWSRGWIGKVRLRPSDVYVYLQNPRRELAQPEDFRVDIHPGPFVNPPIVFQDGDIRLALLEDSICVIEGYHRAVQRCILVEC